MRISWDRLFIEQSKLLAKRSSCPRLAVGTLIVRNNHVISGGYNGSISNDVHCIEDGCLINNNHCIRTVHAEINAISQCAKYGISTEGATIYVTHFPCVSCAKAIVQSGIVNVKYEIDYHNNDYVYDLFKIAGVTVYKIEQQ